MDQRNTWWHKELFSWAQVWLRSLPWQVQKKFFQHSSWLRSQYLLLDTQSRIYRNCLKGKERAWRNAFEAVENEAKTTNVSALLQGKKTQIFCMVGSARCQRNSWGTRPKSYKYSLHREHLIICLGLHWWTVAVHPDTFCRNKIHFQVKESFGPPECKRSLMCLNKIKNILT